MLIAAETTTGLVIGLVGRLFILGLQFAVTTIVQCVGFAGIPGVAMDDVESGSPLTTLLSLAAVMLLLMLNLHVEMLVAVIDSYKAIPLGGGLRPQWSLDSFSNALSETSSLALRLAAPFMVYSVVVNVAIGLANRFAPQVSVYHATTGVVMMGSLLLFWFLVPEWLMSFSQAYRAWLVSGGF